MTQEGIPTTAPAFVWKIKNFSKLTTKQVFSDVFDVGGDKWQLLMFPKGNNVDDHLSLYLYVSGFSTLPNGWSRETDSLSFTVVNQIHAEDSIVKDSKHRFEASESDWGFASFMPLEKLHDPAQGYLIDDTLVIQAQFCYAFTMIKVSRDKDLKEKICRAIYFDMVDHDKIWSFDVPKHTPFRDFKEKVAKEFGISVQFLRFWSWCKRKNRTFRPHQCLTSQHEEQSVEQLRLSLRKGGGHDGKLNLFLEVELGLDLRPIAPPALTKDDILVFFKLYDPINGELRYVGRLFVKRYSQPVEILGKLNQMAGFAREKEIELYEEIYFYPHVRCEHLDKRISFDQSEIINGDIICFQKSLPLRIREQCLYPDVPSFLEYVLNRLMQGIADIPSSSGIPESNPAPNPQSLQQQRNALKDYLALSSEAIVQANAFDEIERISLLLLQHSASSLERSILRDLVARLAAFKEQTELEAQILHLTAQKEELLIRKNAVALELQKFNEQVTKDVEEWRDISEETEQANKKWLQVRETLAHANLSWKLFKQNMEQCDKGNYSYVL